MADTISVGESNLVDPSQFQTGSGTSQDINSLLLQNGTFSQSCTQICIRKEIHDLTSNELDAYFTAIKRLMTTPSTTSPGYSIFEAWAVLHSNMYVHCHGGAPFLPWHRTMLLNFEQELQKIDPSICIPYWDESREAQNPFGSLVWTKYYGAFVAADNNKCLDHGVFANTTYSSTAVTNSSSTCLYRDMAQPQSFTLIDWKQLDALANNAATSYPKDSAYAYFERQLESYHDLIHEKVGGVMAGFASPADPVFYLHHAFYDKVWNDAQYYFAENGISQYNGVDRLSNTVSVSDTMNPWQYQVQNVLNTRDVCYVYAAPGEGRTLDTQYVRNSSGGYQAVALDRSSGFVGQPLALPPPSTQMPTAPSLNRTNLEFSAVAWSNGTNMQLVNGTILPINNSTSHFLATVNQTLDLAPLRQAIASALHGTFIPSISNATLRQQLATTTTAATPSPTNAAAGRSANVALFAVAIVAVAFVI